MKYYYDLFDITIRGEKEGIIRMLNAAIRNAGTGNVIMMDDDVDIMNEKTGESGLTVAITDLLDEEGLKDSIVRKKRLDFEKKLEYYRDVRDGKVSFESNDDEEYAMYKADEMLDNMSDGRIMELSRVRDLDGDLEVSMKYDLGEELEGLSWQDWADWVDICRLYGRQVIVKDVQFLNGHFDEYCYFVIHEKMDDGSVNTTEIRPSQSFNNYIEDLRKIHEIDPLSAVDIIKDLEVNIKRLQAELSERKLMVAVDSICEGEGHLQVPVGVTIIDGITSWKNGEDIKSIYIPASVECINKGTISSSNIESIEISPDNPYFCSVNNCILDKEKTTLLIGCKGSVIPSSVTSIERDAFYRCGGLKEIEIPGSVKTIGNNAFTFCKELERVTIGDGVQEIGDSAFSLCEALKEISTPASLTTIYGGAFYGCSSLEHVAFSGNIREVGMNCFCGCPCAEDLASRYPDLIRIEKAKEYENDGEDRTAENELIDENGRAVIPEGTVEIKETIFQDCRGLVSVEIPGSVRRIGFGAFFNCTSLASIVIPEGVTEIEYLVFKGCKSLVNVTIPESMEKISCDAFEGCPCEDEILAKYKDILD